MGIPLVKVIGGDGREPSAGAQENGGVGGS